MPRLYNTNCAILIDYKPLLLHYSPDIVPLTSSIVTRMGPHVGEIIV